MTIRLPIEILTAIVNELDDVQDSRNVRMTCHALCAAATPIAFRSLSVNTVTVRQVVRSHFDCFDRHSAWFQVLTRTLDELLFNIDVQRPSSELQQDFCGLWNELVHTARDSAEERSTTTEILRRIRRCYIAFHENTDPSIPIAFYETANDHDSILSLGTAYPLCEVESHHRILLPAALHGSEGTTDATVTVTQGTFSTLPAIIHPSQRHHPCLPDQTSDLITASPPISSRGFQDQ